MAVNLGKSTKIALAQLGKNQKWLQEELGISKTRMSVIANSRNGGTRLVDRLAEKLGYTAAEFIELGEDK